jgi:hypothetical protein
MAGREKMRATILTGDNELKFSLKRYLRFLFLEEINEVFTAKLGEPESLKIEMLSSNFWIAEAFNPDNIENPEGFRTVKKFAGKAKVLLLFISEVPENFPKSGSFWICLPSGESIYEKIKNVIKNPPPSEEDYKYLEDSWDLLRYGPSHHPREKILEEKNEGI